MIPTLGTWLQGHVYGNPAPSILDASFLNPGRAEISVTYGGGLFTFNSLDFSSNNGTSNYVISGLLGTTEEYTLSGLTASKSDPNFGGPPGGFQTIGSAPFLSDPISNLLVDITPGSDVSSVNIDNINVSPVPEPSILALMVSAAGFVILKCRRRSGTPQMPSSASRV